MNISAILINCIWAGFYAGGMGLLCTAPLRSILSAFLCGFAGCFSRDILISWGLSQNWSTAAAAASVVLAAMILIRGNEVSPVVLISGIVPLGANPAVLRMIIELMKVSSLKGEALSESSAAFIANTGKVFTTYLAITLGLAIGIMIMRLFRKKNDYLSLEQSFNVKQQ